MKVKLVIDMLILGIFLVGYLVFGWGGFVFAFAALIVGAAVPIFTKEKS